MGIRTLVVEDHTLVRQAIVNLLVEQRMLEIVGEVSNGLDAVTKARELHPDIILMDLYMPGMDGITATGLIKGELPNTQVILLTVSTEKDDLVKAVQAGAKGYILKNIDAVNLTKQIKQILFGGAAQPQDTISDLLAGLAKNGHTTAGLNLPQPLTPREEEVLELVSQGMCNKDIAAALSISLNTVRSYVRSLMQKLNLDNRTQLAIYGIRHGLGRRVEATAATMAPAS
jgi:two-component system nitrate/nitrite response regulator NarL